MPSPPPSQAPRRRHFLFLSPPPAPRDPLLAAIDHRWTEKAMVIQINLVGDQSGKDEMLSNAVVISSLAKTLDMGEPFEQEHAVLCLLTLCSGDDRCIQMVLLEGVIPALVSILVNGTTRGEEKAQKLLMLLRQQRQHESTPVEYQDREFEDSVRDGKIMPAQEASVSQFQEGNRGSWREQWCRQ